MIFPAQSIASLSGILVKRTKPTLKPIFTKEPFSLSLSQFDKKEHCSKIENNEYKKKPAYNFSYRKLGSGGFLRVSVRQLPG